MGADIDNHDIDNVEPNGFGPRMLKVNILQTDYSQDADWFMDYSIPRIDRVIVFGSYKPPYWQIFTPMKQTWNQQDRHK